MENGQSIFGAPAQTQSSSSFNPTYFLSPEGALKCFQFLFGMVVWGLAASVGGKCDLGAYQFVMVVFVIGWLLSTALLVVFVMGIDSGVGAAIPWAIFEFIYCSSWSLFYFIAASVQAAHACKRDHLVAAAVIGFFVWVSYVAHAIFSFRKWKGFYPWKSGQSGTAIEP